MRNIGSRLQWLPLLVFGVSVALGYVVVVRPSLALIFAAIVITAWAAITRTARPWLMGVLILAYMNALPFVDLVAMRLPAGLRFDDVAMAGMIGLGVAVTWRDGRDSAVVRLKHVLLLIMAYWVVVLIITIATGAGTPLLSALYGRDFLAIVMSLGIAATSVTREDSERLVAVVVGGACLYAIAHLTQFLTGLDTSLITHPYATGEAAGTARIFSKAMAMVVPALMLAVGRAVVASEPRRRVWYWIATGLLVIEILIEFTRANYLGMVVAMSLGAAIIVRTKAERPESRATIAIMSAAIIAMGTWIASGMAVVQNWIANSVVTARATSAATDLASRGGTFGYRLALYDTTLKLVGKMWLTGVGFWHPAEHYVSILPQGSIRNSDTGILGVFATMGVIGVVLMVIPAYMALRWGVAALRSRLPWVRATGWSVVGYVVWAALTSFSLSFFSYGAGIAATAIMVGLMAGAQHADERSELLEEGLVAE